MATASITETQALALFAGYLNVSQTDAENLVAYIFGTGDRTITGDLIVTGSVATNTLKQRTTAGLSIGTATDQKLGFFGATPVVQQIAATGGGMTVDQLLTKLQLIGIFKQS